MAERSGIPKETLYWWLENDKAFQIQLATVKETLDKDLNRDNSNTKVKLNTPVLSFGINIVLDETTKDTPSDLPDLQVEPILL